MPLIGSREQRALREPLDARRVVDNSWPWPDSIAALAPGVAERLLRPFFTTKNHSNGLGLRLSQGLVERYGGGIGAGNRADGQSGEVFSVRLLTELQAPEAVNMHDGRPGNVVNASP